MHSLIRSQSALLGVGALLVFVIAPAWSALPGDAVEELKKNASEKLRVEITKVEEAPAQQNPQGYLPLIYTAKVTKVDRSKNKVKVGSTITIDAYHWTVPFAGPTNPPLLKTGWKGGIHLNAVDVKKGHFKLAAHGDSFYQ